MIFFYIVDFIICDILIIAFKEVDNMQESSISEK